MRTDIPLSQQFDAYELESKGLRDLFKVELNDASHTTLYVTPHAQVNYMDHTWEYFPCKLSDKAQNSTGEQSRPKLTFVNPKGAFSVLVEQGSVDGAIISRYRVLLSDLAADVRAYTKNMWIISKVVSLDKNLAVFELRSTLDGPNYLVPARSFYPPEFPHVSLR